MHIPRWLRSKLVDQNGRTATPVRTQSTLLIEQMEERTLLSFGTSASIAPARGITRVDGEDVIVDVLVAVPPKANLEEVGRAALEALGAEPIRSENFSTTGAVWDQFLDADPGNDFVTQYYNPANDPTGGQGEAALLASQATWNAVGASSFEISYGGTTDRLPSLVRETPGPQTFDGFNDVAWMAIRDRNTLAVTWSGTSTDEADMAMNTNFAWFTDGTNDFDAETVFLHENGHVAGLGHSEVSGSVMEAVYAGVRRSLHQDDVNGIVSLYPSGPIDMLPTVSITSPEPGEAVSGAVLVSAAADDDNGVQQVEFFLDGESIGIVQSAPYSVDWDSLGVPDGSHTITATATDTAGQTSSDIVAIVVDNIADPPSTDPEMYIWNVAWTEKVKGPRTELRITIDVHADSDGDQIAEAGDAAAADAAVTLLLTHDTDGDGLFEPGADDASWTGTAATNGAGQVTFKLNGAPSGDYFAVVTDLTHATLVWDSSMDADNPDVYQGLPGGADALSDDVIAVLSADSNLQWAPLPQSIPGGRPSDDAVDSEDATGDEASQAETTAADARDVRLTRTVRGQAQQIELLDAILSSPLDDSL